MARSHRSAAAKTDTDSIKRTARLCRLLHLVAGKGATRTTILRKLRLDIRTFYRALESLREVGVIIESKDGKYVLEGKVEDAIDRIPFPDPQLTLGEARQLSKGRAAIHRKIKELLGQILPV